MAESLSIYELKKLYEKKRPSRICFNTDDQSWCDPFDSLSLSLVFSTIIIAKNPALIYLTNGEDKLCLNRIRRIEREWLVDDAREILTVYCLDKLGHGISYGFLVDY